MTMTTLITRITIMLPMLHDDHDHSACDHDHGHCDHDHDHEHHHHSDHLAIDGFTSVSFQSDRPFAIKKFQHFLDTQLPSTVFRAKGILWFDESPKRHIFHLSGKRFSLDDEDWKGQPKNSGGADWARARSRCVEKAARSLSLHPFHQSGQRIRQVDKGSIKKRSAVESRSHCRSLFCLT